MAGRSRAAVRVDQTDPQRRLIGTRVRHHEGGEDHNRALLDRVNASGEIYLSHAVLRGRFVLRLVVGGMYTTREDLQLAWDVLRREAAAQQ